MVNTGINYRTDTPQWVLRETVAHSFVMVVVVVIYYYHSHSGKCHKIFLLTFPFLIHPAACIVRITHPASTHSLAHSLTHSPFAFLPLSLSFKICCCYHTWYGSFFFTATTTIPYRASTKKFNNKAVNRT